MAEISGVKSMTVTWSPYANKAVPADVPIDTAFDLPVGFPEIQALIGGEQMAQAAGEYTVIPLVAAVPTTTLGTGYMSQVDGNSIKMGDINQIKDTVSITYRYV